MLGEGAEMKMDSPVGRVISRLVQRAAKLELGLPEPIRRVHQSQRQLDPR